jgi:hypothetical protein
MNVATRLAKIEQTVNPEPRQRGPFDGFAARMRGLQAKPRAPTPVMAPRGGSLAARMQQRAAQQDAADLV